MHTYIVRVELVGENSKEDVDKVKKLFQEALGRTKIGDDDNTAKIKAFMKKELADLINKSFRLYCDPVGKDKRNYFLNIVVDGCRNIVMKGIYCSMDSLKNIATYNIAKQLRINTDVKKLIIPDTLKPDINLICRQLNKEKSSWPFFG